MREIMIETGVRESWEACKAADGILKWMNNCYMAYLLVMIAKSSRSKSLHGDWVGCRKKNSFTKNDSFLGSFTVGDSIRTFWMFGLVITNRNLKFVKPSQKHWVFSEVVCFILIMEILLWMVMVGVEKQPCCLLFLFSPWESTEGRTVGRTSLEVYKLLNWIACLLH